MELAERYNRDGADTELVFLDITASSDAQRHHGVDVVARTGPQSIYPPWPSAAAFVPSPMRAASCSPASRQGLRRNTLPPSAAPN